MSETATRPASGGDGEAVDSGKGRIFPCEQCGADLEFHIGSQRMRCSHCAFERDLTAEPGRVAERDFDAGLARIAARRTAAAAPATEETNEVRCSSCGAGVTFRGTLTSTECAFCGTPVQRENVHAATDRIPVDGVLAFHVDRKVVESRLRAWVASRWFAPNDFKQRGAHGRFEGVYLPYWTFDLMTATRWDGQRGDHYYVTEGHGKDQRQVRKTRWSHRSGWFQRFFDDLLVLGARGLPDGLVDKLAPWPLPQCVPFDQEMLAGFLAQTYDVEMPVAFRTAKARADAAIESQVRGEIGGDEQRVGTIDTDYTAITYKHLLLPVWLLSYKFREKTYRVVVNACTGELHGERPWSAWKIVALVLAILAVVGVVAFVAFVASR